MSAARLDDYEPIVGRERIALLRRLAAPLAGKRVVLVNSTRTGGGVAEILEQHVPLMRELGIDMRWEVITGTGDFFDATKTMHNALQGSARDLTEKQRQVYLETSRENAARLDLEADVVVIHDPQPAPLIDAVPKKCPWIWRCHIDAQRPNRGTWRFLSGIVSRYDASVFSIAAFARVLPHPQYLIAPAIDPLSAKNRELEPAEIANQLARFGINPDRPVVVQVSRFDRFKNPVGVIRAFKLVRRRDDAQLVLAGGGAADDPEGSEVLREVQEVAANDPDVHVLNLPPDSHREINALQRAAAIIVQNSTREGFGLTVTEGLWKCKPVVAGAAGGLAIQVFDHVTGFLVHSTEGLAYRIRYLLNRPAMARAMGLRGRELVRQDFLLVRHIRNWLTLYNTVLGTRGNA